MFREKVHLLNHCNSQYLLYASCFWGAQTLNADIQHFHICSSWWSHLGRSMPGFRRSPIKRKNEKSASVVHVITCLTCYSYSRQVRNGESITHRKRACAQVKPSHLYFNGAKEESCHNGQQRKRSVNQHSEDWVGEQKIKWWNEEGITSYSGFHPLSPTVIQKAGSCELNKSFALQKSIFTKERLQRHSGGSHSHFQWKVF